MLQRQQKGRASLNGLVSTLFSNKWHPLPAKTALVIQNDPMVGMGLFEAALKENGYAITVLDAQAAELSNINPLAFEVMFVLGGSMGAYEHEQYPWLVQEEALIRKRIEADLPLMGSCLGGQLIAQVLGARVYHCEENKEVGYFPLHLTDTGKQHAIASYAAEGIRVPESHGDIFDLPEGVTLLATTDTNPNQVFVKGNVIAFQFHPEVKQDTFKVWISHWKSKDPDFDDRTPTEQMQQYAPAFEKTSMSFLTEWLDKIEKQSEYTLRLC